MENLPNPLTPLAYLPPNLALQFEASRYLYVGTFGAFVWDWLMSMSEEYRMIVISKKSFPLVVYFLARLGALGYVLTSTLFQTAIIPNCNGLLVGIGVCYIVAMPGASFLFYLRVRAIYYENRVVQVFFALLWLAVLGAVMTVPFAIKGMHIGPTQYCINSQVKPYATSTVITSTVNDTLILLAISYKLTRNVNPNSLREMGTSFFSGRGLSKISKALVQSGQIYYLSTVGMNILTMTMVLTNSTPPVYKAMVTIPNIALQNVMACRVFRQLRLGIIGLPGESSGSSSAQQSLPLSWRHARLRNSEMEGSRSTTGAELESKAGQTFDDDGYHPSRVMDIKVMRDVEFTDPGGHIPMKPMVS